MISLYSIVSTDLFSNISSRSNAKLNDMLPQLEFDKKSFNQLIHLN